MILSITNVLKVAAIIGAITIMGGCAKKKAIVESVADIQKREGIPVTVISAVSGTFDLTERSGGTVEGYQQSLLTSGISATVASINAVVGQTVAKNFEIMRLYPQTSSPLEVAQANYDNSAKSLERVKALADQGGVSKDALDQSSAGTAVAKANLDGAIRSEHILAPFDGMVVEVYQTPGALVASGKNLVKVATIGKARVKLNVAGDIVGKFKIGQTALAIVGSDTVEGKIEKVALAGDETNHNFLVDAVFPNQQKKLLPGMYALVDVIVEHRTGVVSVPTGAVVTTQDGLVSWIVKGGTASSVPVTIGGHSGQNVELLSGVSSGDVVVTTGQSLLTSGAKVKIIQ